MDDSSGIAWNTMPSSAGFVGPQYAAWRFKTSRRLGSNSSTPNGPVPMARVSSSLPSPAAPFGMTPLYLPPRLMRNVAAGAWRTKDRKSTRLNSSHLVISYAVFCLKKKKNLHKLDELQQDNPEKCTFLQLKVLEPRCGRVLATDLPYVSLAYPDHGRVNRLLEHVAR